MMLPQLLGTGFSGIAGRQCVLVTGPRGAVGSRERVRVRSPVGCFPVLYPSTVLQLVAL